MQGLPKEGGGIPVPHPQDPDGGSGEDVALVHREGKSVQKEQSIRLLPNSKH